MLLRLKAVLATFGAWLTWSGRAGHRQNPVTGALWILLAMFMMAAIGVLVRTAALDGMDPLQIMFLRNAFAFLWLLPLLVWRGPSIAWTTQPSLYGMRVGLSCIAMTATFYAYALIPVGEVTAIGFLSPLFGTLVAILLLGERVRMRRWLALLAGLMGALIILRPDGSGFGWGQFAALISAMTIGMIGPLVKQLSAEDDADRIVFITTGLMTVLSLGPAVFVWTWPSLELWLALLLLGLVGVIGQLALVRGYTEMEASLVMTFKFSRLPFAVILGYLAFGETIDSWTWVGAFVIFVAAAYVTHREAALKGKHAALSLPPTAGV